MSTKMNKDANITTKCPYCRKDVTTELMFTHVMQECETLKHISAVLSSGDELMISPKTIQGKKKLIRALQMDVDQVESWSPNAGDEYYCSFNIDQNTNEPMIWENDQIDNSHLKRGDVFKTLEEAQEDIQYQELRCQQLLTAKEAWNRHPEPLDWTNINQEKFYTMYDHFVKEYQIGITRFQQERDVIYFPTITSARQSIQGFDKPRQEI